MIDTTSLTPEQRQFPIGKWQVQLTYNELEIQENIQIIATYPEKYRALVGDLMSEELLRTYREGSWNIHQLVVHLADIHILHLARFKQALVVTNPDGYIADIDGWATLPEVHTLPLADALNLLEATHKRWLHILKTMDAEAFARTYYHPIRQLTLTLAQALDMAAWHCRHHFEHIKIALADTDEM